VNHFEAPADDAEVDRLMRDSDSLGADTSLFLRAIRQLTDFGKPIGRIFIPLIPTVLELKMPIGMLTYTDKNRLVFWPVLPRGNCGITNVPDAQVPDHVTVEFPSEKLHVTSYGPDGRKLPVPKNAWRSAPSEMPEIRLLFAYYIRLSIIREQDVLVTRRYATPPTDEERRKLEFARGANNFVPYDMSEQIDPAGADFVFFAIYKSSPGLTADNLPNALMPKPSISDFVENWPDNEHFPLFVGQLTLNDLNLMLVAGFPPGRLRSDIFFGFPSRKPRLTEKTRTM
jgi:hypothetical protein